MKWKKTIEEQVSWWSSVVGSGPKKIELVEVKDGVEGEVVVVAVVGFHWCPSTRRQNGIRDELIVIGTNGDEGYVHM